jgi:hypothetical protein
MGFGGRGYLAFVRGAEPFFCCHGYNLYRSSILEDGHGQDPAIRFDPGSRGERASLQPRQGSPGTTNLDTGGAAVQDIRFWLPFAFPFSH